MHTEPRLRSLATALVTLEYALADFNATALQDDNDTEHNRLNELVSTLAEAANQLMDALGAIGLERVNDSLERHTEH